jgi:hypothetical protein
MIIGARESKVKPERLQQRRSSRGPPKTSGKRARESKVKPEGVVDDNRGQQARESRR